MRTKFKVYRNPVTLPVTLAGLAAGTTITTAKVDIGDDINDVMLQGKCTIGTLPTASTIDIAIFGSIDGITYTGNVTGSVDGTVTTENLPLLPKGSTITTGTVADTTYAWGPISIAGLFGGNLPKSLGVAITNNGTVALNATAGNHVITASYVQESLR